MHIASLFKNTKTLSLFVAKAQDAEEEEDEEDESDIDEGKTFIKESLIYGCSLFLR